MNVFSIYRKDKDNIGDMYSAPFRYFPFLSGDSADIGSVPVSGLDDRISGKFVVVGGGGCVDLEAYRKQVKAVPGHNPMKAVAWGVGTNSGNVFPNYDFLKGYDLVGCRDWNSPFEWVPCVSCMSPLMDEARQMRAVFPVVAYFHSCRRVEKNLGVPVMNNRQPDLATVLRFLASGLVVVTNTYHGAYWATLIGRAVVILDPWSSKFFHMRHRHIFAQWPEVEKQVGKAVRYEHALSECREANLRFSEKVQRLME